MTASDYRVTEQLHWGKNSKVYRAVRSVDGGQVILKAPHSQYPSVQELDRLKGEYATLQRFDDPHIVKALALEHDGNGLVLMLEDFAGVSLTTFLDGKPLELSAFLEIACTLAAALQTVHQQRIIHKDINPSNIVINPHSREIKLIDFGISSMLSREPQQQSASEAFEGTLTYISPEQTGRMNRVIDIRSDLYSLGITFYEMLTGEPPFLSNDPMELVHSHIAKSPRPPIALRPDLPPMISELVLKLLAKSAEERYQTAAGLLADLDQCRDMVRREEQISSFTLGQHDVSDRFKLPEQLYGRDNELAQLLAAFGRASEGDAELLLVAGYSGIGKSRLVHEVQQPIVQRKGYFVSGKFDQLRRNVPFASLYAAFRELMQQLLTESEERVLLWRALLLEAVGSVGQVLVEAIPEVELLIGKQPPVPELPPEQARNRFSQVFHRFVQVFCQPEHPLCIFLDDLQWVDSATLQWIESLLAERQTGSLLVIGAYRDNEVSASHPLLLALDRLRRQEAAVNEVRLLPLERPAFDQFVADSVATEPDACRDLADVIFAKTNGNPFFVNQCLLALYEDDSIWFDPQRTRWCYDVQRARQARISDNVVELLSGRIESLTPGAQEVMRVAACVGNSFDLATLLVVMGLERDEVRRQVNEAVDSGLLVPLRTRSSGDGEGYRFLHDRVQQAALSLLSEAEVAQVRLRIGRLMLAASSNIEDDERLFEIADHLNAATDLVGTPQEREQLARVNLAACLRAKRSNAYAIARDYVRRAMSMQPESVALADSQFVTHLLLERAECEHLCGNGEGAEHFYNQALAQAGSDLDKALVYEKKVHYFTNLARFADAYATGREALLIFDTRLPARFTPPLFAVDFVKARLLLRGRQVSDLVNLPQMTDERLRVMVRIMAAVAKAAYQIRPEMCVAIAAKIVILCLQHGNIGDGVIGYMAFGAIFLGAIFGDHPTGFDFGRVSLALIDRYNNEKHKAEVNFVVGYFATAWMRPATEAEQLWRVAYEAGLESGDLFHAACACCGMLQSHYMRGVALDEIWQESQRFLDFLTRVDNREAVGTVLAVRQTIRNLRGETRSHLSYSTDDFDEEAYVAELAGYGSRHFAHYYFINKMQTLYLWQEYQAGLQVAQRSASYLKDSGGMLHSVEHHFYHALLLAALYPEARPSQQSAWKRTLLKIAKKFGRWAADCPHNYRHKAELIAAEIARVLGNDAQAAEGYNAAIAAAAEYGYLQVQALANELAARFHLTHGRERIAWFHLQEATYAYTRWGATAYVDFLVTSYPQFLDNPREDSFNGEHKLRSGTKPRTDSTTSGVLDLTTVLKSAETLSSEIHLPDLLRKLMTIIIENAGAQRGVLLLKRGQQLVVQAERAVGSDQVDLLEAVPLTAYDALPRSIVNYVARTREPVVLNNAAHQNTYAQDRYIARQQPKSVLCQPLLNQGQLTGVLYLENNLTADAFTPNRLRVLNLLSSQAAISIENAELYTSIQSSEKKYRTLFEDSRDSIFIATLDDQIADINPAGLRLLGYTRNEIAALDVRAFYADVDDQRRFRAAIEQQGSVKDFEVNLRTRSGSKLDCLLTATLRYTEDGNLLGYQGIIRDITAQKHAEQERLRLSTIERELSLAHEIQLSLLPPSQPAWPDVDVLCYSAPAREVGGDFYSYHAFPQSNEETIRSRYALAVGDVTGKGVSAALLMATIFSQFDASLALELSPVERMVHLDQAILRYTKPRRQNCALCYIEIERSSSGEASLFALNAGCIPPYIKRASGEVESLTIGGFALGQGFGMRLGYTGVQLPLAKGDLVILTSDGVVEANNATNEMFSFERLERAIGAGPSHSAEALLDYLQQEVAAFVGETEQHDDLTIVIAQV